MFLTNVKLGTSFSRRNLSSSGCAKYFMLEEEMKRSIPKRRRSFKRFLLTERPHPCFARSLEPCADGSSRIQRRLHRSVG